VAGIHAPEANESYRLSVPAGVIQVTEIAERERLNPGSEMRREFAERTAQLGRRCNARRDIEVWLACASGRVNALIGRYGFYKHGRHRPIAAFDARGPFALKGSFDQRWMNESMFDHIGIVARDVRASARLYARQQRRSRLLPQRLKGRFSIFTTERPPRLARIFYYIRMFRAFMP
jgi:hypothetical protein